jgi:3-oxoacyl-[acyl-carrier protein] reductase
MKSIFITGASRGIGRAIALEFSENSPNIFYTTYNKDLQAMESLHKLLNDKGNINFPFKVDVSNRRDINNALSHFKSMDSQFGIDILINNAGVVMDKTLKNMSDKEWDRVIDVNLTGIFNVTKAVLPFMNTKNACIINITSIIGIIGGFGQCNYAASKAGVIGFTKSLAKELAPKNIRVNAIACGFVDTDMTKNLSDDAKLRALNKIPMERFARPEEIAKIVRLISESTYMTGQVITVDGGLT